MSVLIKGMDMPKDDCQYLVYRYGAKFFAANSRDGKLRPLVEVPTPHGALIDIDKAMNRLPENYDKHDLMYVIATAPTIIDAEEEA